MMMNAKTVAADTNSLLELIRVLGDPAAAKDAIDQLHKAATEADETLKQSIERHSRAVALEQALAATQKKMDSERAELAAIAKEQAQRGAALEAREQAVADREGNAAAAETSVQAKLAALASAQKAYDAKIAGMRELILKNTVA